MKHTVLLLGLLMAGCSWWCPEYVMNPPESVTFDTTIVTPPVTLEDLFILPEEGTVGTGPIRITVRDTVFLASDARVKVVHVTADCPPETLVMYRTLEATPKVVEKDVPYIPWWGWFVIVISALVGFLAVVAVLFRKVI
jgi:hypothetical protein